MTPNQSLQVTSPKMRCIFGAAPELECWASVNLALAVLVGALVLAVSPARAQDNRSAVPTPHMETLTSQVQSKAALAVAQFQERAANRLDYSVRSLAVVEELLAEASQHKAQMS